MEEKEKSESCDCKNGECCPPKKPARWKNLVAFAILLIALSIAMVKIYRSNHSVSANPASCSSENSACCDTTKTDSTGKSCCPKN